jgi:nucleotide-binding universal stress UspA family protein
VLALSSASAPTQTLLRARALADGLGGVLHVVRVLPEANATPAVASHATFPELLCSVERTLTAHRTTRAWMRAALPDGCGVDRFAILHGDFVDRIAVYAREADAHLILIAADDDDGGLVTRLAAITGTPVLASRTAAKSQTIVAATDLRHPDYPVLHFAAALGRQLQTSVIAVHNFRLDAAEQQPEGDGPGVPSHPHHAARLARLQQASQRLPAATRVIVRQEHDPVDAILDQARAEQADLVVVGARSRAWFERSGRGVASLVVNRARRSVLVIPVGEANEPNVELAWG